MRRAAPRKDSWTGSCFNVLESFRFTPPVTEIQIICQEEFSRLRNEIMLSLIQKPDQNAPFYMCLLYTNSCYTQTILFFHYKVCYNE